METEEKFLIITQDSWEVARLSYQPQTPFQSLKLLTAHEEMELIKETQRIFLSKKRKYILDFRPDERKTLDEGTHLMNCLLKMSVDPSRKITLYLPSLKTDQDSNLSVTWTEEGLPTVEVPDCLKICEECEEPIKSTRILKHHTKGKKHKKNKDLAAFIDLHPPRVVLWGGQPNLTHRTPLQDKKIEQCMVIQQLNPDNQEVDVEVTATELVTLNKIVFKTTHKMVEVVTSEENLYPEEDEIAAYKTSLQIKPNQPTKTGFVLRLKPEKNLSSCLYPILVEFTTEKRFVGKSHFLIEASNHPTPNITIGRIENPSVQWWHQKPPEEEDGPGEDFRWLEYHYLTLDEQEAYRSLEGKNIPTYLKTETNHIIKTVNKPTTYQNYKKKMETACRLEETASTNTIALMDIPTTTVEDTLSAVTLSLEMNDFQQGALKLKIQEKVVLQDTPTSFIAAEVVKINPQTLEKPGQVVVRTSKVISPTTNIRKTTGRVPTRLTLQSLKDFGENIQSLFPDYHVNTPANFLNFLDLSKDQLLCTTKILGAPRGIPFVLTGAAGTGKSRCAREIVLQIVNQGGKVLFTTPTNLAADDTTLKLEKDLQSLKSKRNIRLKRMCTVSTCHLPTFNQNLCFTSKEGKHTYPSDEDIAETDIIVATYMTAAKLGWGRPSAEFECVVVEEAGFGMESSTIPAILPFVSESTLILVLGDLHQICAKPQSKTLRMTKGHNSLLSRLSNHTAYYAPDSNYHELTENHRNPPCVNKLLNIISYKDKLTSTVIPTEDAKITAIHTTGLTKSLGTSAYNLVEALTVLEACRELMKSELEHSTCIVVYYQAQRSLIKQLLCQANLKIPVHTTENAQGSEVDNVIISVSPRVHPGTQKNISPWTESRERAVVALSRSKKRVIIVGNLISLATTTVFNTILRGSCHIRAPLHLHDALKGALQRTTLGAPPAHNRQPSPDPQLEGKTPHSAKTLEIDPTLVQPAKPPKGEEPDKSRDPRLQKKRPQSDVTPNPRQTKLQKTPSTSPEPADLDLDLDSPSPAPSINQLDILNILEMSEDSS